MSFHKYRPSIILIAHEAYEKYISSGYPCAGSKNIGMQVFQGIEHLPQKPFLNIGIKFLFVQHKIFLLEANEYINA